MPLQRLSLRLVLTVTTSLLLSSPGVRAQKPDANAQGSGTISGQVFLRTKPVAGIPVVAVAGDTINRRESAGRAVTDGQGYFRITGLPPGQYQVWAIAPSLIAEQQPHPGSPYGSIKSILLATNEDVANVDLKLASGAVITGRVTTVENKPVVEERVLLELLDENGNPRFGFFSGSFREEMYRTDDRGIYRVYGLPPGRYKVSVGHNPNEGLRSSLYPRTYYAAPSDPSKAAVIELKEGSDASGIDIKVEPPLVTFAVSGRIVDATTGRSIAGARFKIAAVEKDPGRTPPFVGLPTDSNGEFKFEGMRPGSYSVVASSEYSGGGNYYGDPVNFEIVDQDVTGLEVKAVPGLTLSGSVIAEGLTTSQLLSLLKGLTVYAWPEPFQPNRGSGGGSSVVAADGSFQLAGLRPGRVRIGVDTMGRVAVRPTIARVEREGVDVGQTVDISQSTSGLVVVINYGTGLIRGAVTFTGGEPPSDSRIIVSFRKEGSRDAMATQTDARGNFMIKNLAPGTYELDVQVVSSRPSPPPARRPQKQFVDVTNGSESEVKFLVDVNPVSVRP
ncbi:MAG TPA: carboxypeptidase regulatory-like domain-containing protein [Pyrinomonadaceae bacterium]|nr:carboxypeptidase regulatory-like domain-containing protein [Pyrinomonadaceae bacterium]